MGSVQRLKEKDFIKKHIYYVLVLLFCRLSAFIDPSYFGPFPLVAGSTEQFLLLTRTRNGDNHKRMAVNSDTVISYNPIAYRLLYVAVKLIMSRNLSESHTYKCT